MKFFQNQRQVYQVKPQIQDQIQERVNQWNTPVSHHQVIHQVIQKVAAATVIVMYQRHNHALH